MMERHDAADAARSPLSARWAGAAADLQADGSASPASSSLASAARLAPGNIRSLILEKERELHDINEYRIRTLEALLRDKEAAAGAYKQKLAKLQEDFKYNLKLLEGRDEELALYDANFAALKGALRDRETELSELQAQHAELAAESKRAQQQAREQEAFYQQKLKDARAQMEGARWRHDDELRAQQETLDAARRQLERQLRDKEDEADAQRREASAAFDDLLRAREAEHKAALEELQAANRELELKCKSATREADVLTARLDDLKLKLERTQEAAAGREKENKALEWQLADLRGSKDARIQELEGAVEKLKENKQALLDEYESKMAELLQSLHAVERAFVQQKTKLDDELQQTVKRKDQEAQANATKLEAKISALTAKLRDADERCDRLEAELKQATWERDDLAAEKDREVDKLKSELQDLDDQRQAAVAELKQQLWAQDREAATLREKLKDATSQLQIQKEKDKVQRQELLDAVDKQEDLRREVLAVNLRWENKLQEEKQELEVRYDLRARELQQAKDRVMMEKQAMEERLTHAENELQRTRSELRAAKADARLNAAFGTVEPSSKHTSPLVEQARSSPPQEPSSPLWSDDQGAISPGVSVSPLLMTDSPVVAPKSNGHVGGSGDDGSGFSFNSVRPSDLQTENTKLRDMIRQMKDAITQQVQGSDKSNANGKSNASLVTFQLEQSEQRCNELERQLHLLQQQQSACSNDRNAVERELADAQRVVQTRDKQIAELEAETTRLRGGLDADAALKSSNVALEAQNADLKRKLAAANSDIDRLVRERAQLMDLSNQLRADLRRLMKSDAAAASSVSRPEFAGKKDYENLIAELTRSLEEARVHNKTLKKELRRMVKLQVQHEQHRDANEEPRKPSRIGSLRSESVASSPSSSLDESGNPQRHASTLSMMKTLDTAASPVDRRRSTATTRSSTSSRDASMASGAALDVELLTLARHKRASASESAALRRTRSGTGASRLPSERARNVPPSIPERSDDGFEEEKEEELPPPPLAPSSALSSLFGRGQDGSVGAENGLFPSETVSASTARTEGVSDARLRLQQAKEMLMLSGRKAARSSSAVAARSSDRETPSQRDAIHKMKELQSKRAEMVGERKKVRNYSLAT